MRILNDGIVEALEQLQQYLCTMTNPEDPDDIEYECQGLIGDQLTVERCVNAKLSRQNGYNTQEKLEGFNFGIADWHTGMKCCMVNNTVC